MISSEAKPTAEWQSDPLLSHPVRQAPAFLRMPWDNAQATDFGPWRVVPNDAPLVATSIESASSPDIDLLPEPEDASDVEAEAATHEPVVIGPTEEEIQAIRAAAYDEGLAEGKTLGKQEAESAFADERARDHALLTQVVAGLQALGQDHARLFDPLYRLSIHLAEQLVRGELRLSGAAIEQLVKHCLAQFDQPTDKAIVHLNPDDLERMKAYGDAAKGLRLEADARLQSGSVRVEVNDTVVEDLIEHRLEVLARQLLGDVHTKGASSSLDVVPSEDVDGDGQSDLPEENP